MKTITLLLLGAGIVLAVLKVHVIGFELLFAAMVAAVLNQNDGKN
jgi:hypothetical protein